MKAIGGPRRLSAAERRSQLIAVAEELAGAAGLDAVRLDAVARAAGVTRPVVYDHFSSREVLLSEMLRGRAEAIAAEVGAAVDGVEGLEPLLRAGTLAYLDAIGRRGFVTRALLGSGGSPVTDGARRIAHENASRRWGALIAESSGIESGEAAAIANYAIAGLLRLIEEWQLGRLSRESVIENHVGFVVAMVRSFNKKADR